MLSSLALLLAIGGAGYVLGHRLRLVPGPLLALILGALVGCGSPLGTNLLWSTGQALPPEPLNSFRTMGAILLLWGAGVELEVGMLRQGRRLLGAAAVGLGGALCSAGLAWALLELGILGAFPLSERLGIALLAAASAIPVLIAIVQSLGQLHHPRTRTALAAALFVDLAIVALIPVVSAEHPEDLPLAHLVKTLGYLALMIGLAEGPWRNGLRSAGRVIWGSSPRQAVIIALGFGLTLGWVGLAQQLGLDLVPAALGWGIGSKPLFFPQAEEGPNPFFDALFPFETSYFALAGAMLDLRLVTWGGVLFGLVAIAGKLAGGSVRGAEGLRLGVLLVPRGAVDLVLAVTLLANGLLSTSGYALAVTMIAITTVGGALLARLAFEAPPAEPERVSERPRLGPGYPSLARADVTCLTAPGCAPSRRRPHQGPTVDQGADPRWVGPRAGSPASGWR